ncbi:MAG: hypothetical protein IPN96_12040 [Anaerolineales bacterium]|nr:hypothetical protein [Anaerolineales bacterium]
MCRVPYGARYLQSGIFVQQMLQAEAWIPSRSKSAWGSTPSGAGWEQADDASGGYTGYFGSGACQSRHVGGAWRPDIALQRQRIDGGELPPAVTLRIAANNA